MYRVLGLTITKTNVPQQYAHPFRILKFKIKISGLSLSNSIRMQNSLHIIACYLSNKNEIYINYFLSSQRLNCSVINVPTHKTNPFDTPLINASNLIDCLGESNTGNVCGKKSVNIYINW